MLQSNAVPAPQHAHSMKASHCRHGKEQSLAARFSAGPFDLNCVHVVRCHSFAKGGEQPFKASMGVMFASRWPKGQSAAAPSLTAAAVEPQSADMETAATALTDQDGVADAGAAAASTSGLDGKAGNYDGTAAVSCPRNRVHHAHACLHAMHFVLNVLQLLCTGDPAGLPVLRLTCTMQHEFGLGAHMVSHHLNQQFSAYCYCFLD